MSRGGKRPGAGRPKGALDKVSMERRAQVDALIADMDSNPLEVVLKMMHGLIPYDEEKLKCAQLALPYTAHRCDLCNQEAPFRAKGGEPYLECHHILWLSKKGVDRIENAAAICPNCHRKMHILNQKRDRDLLLKKIKARDA